MRLIVSVPYLENVASKRTRTHSKFSAVEGLKHQTLENNVVNAPPCAARTVSSSAWAHRRPMVKGHVVRDGALLAQAKILKKKSGVATTVWNWLRILRRAKKIRTMEMVATTDSENDDSDEYLGVGDYSGQESGEDESVGRRRQNRHAGIEQE